jgi:hypothetical protein
LGLELISTHKVQTTDRLINELQSNILSSLNNLQAQINAQALPFNGGVILKGVALLVGLNTIPTTLAKKLTGWSIIRQRAQSSIWDSQDINPTPSTTLILNSSAAVNVDLFVF